MLKHNENLLVDPQALKPQVRKIYRNHTRTLNKVQSFIQSFGVSVRHHKKATNPTLHFKVLTSKPP